MTSLMLALEWRSSMHGLLMTMWLTVGWLLVSAGFVTVVAFLLRLLWYSLGAIVVDRPARAAAARGFRAQGEVG